MTIELSPPVRRLAAVALLVIALLLVWVAIMTPLLDAYKAALDTIERLTPVLDHRRLAARDISVLTAELKQLKDRGRSANGLLDGTNESIAAAHLQEQLKGVVDHVNGDLKSTQILPMRDDGGFRRVTVRAGLSVNIAGLQRVLYELEASTPYLFLDNIEIVRRNDARGKTETPGDPALEVRFDLIGYMRKAA
jgi:general secretion pathway protein M